MKNTVTLLSRLNIVIAVLLLFTILACKDEVGGKV